MLGVCLNKSNRKPSPVNNLCHYYFLFMLRNSYILDASNYMRSFFVFQMYDRVFKMTTTITSMPNNTMQPTYKDFGDGKNYGFDYSDVNGTGMDEYMKLMIMNEKQSWFDEKTEIIIIAVFTLMILIGAIGNGLVCIVVIKNAHMRTPRNIFIINLAISDLTLCLFTQPLNLYRLLNIQWHLGAFMCKFSAMLQGTNVFVSTISITAIALDRFQVIVYPTKDSMKKIGGAAALITIWVISFLMSSPLLIFSVHIEIKPLPEIEFYQYRCVEDLTLRAEKAAYSVASMVVQYILPIITVTIAHARICNKLKYRMANRRMPRSSGENGALHGNRNTDGRTARKRRTNILLAMIAIVFALSWMPLNIINILVEFLFQVFRNENIDTNIVFVVCHILVLSSACTNPVLYGWLNENFRKEFLNVLRWCNICDTGLQKLKKTTCCRRHVHQSVPTIILSDDVKELPVMNGCGRRPTNTSQLFMTTEIDQSHSAVSL